MTTTTNHTAVKDKIQVLYITTLVLAKRRGEGYLYVRRTQI